MNSSITRNVFNLFLCLKLILCCEDQWKLESSTIKSDSRVSFTNTTILGNYEVLAWTWLEPEGVSWTTKIHHYFNEEKMMGGFVYKKFNRYKNKMASLTWKLVDGQVFWKVEGNNEITHPGWKVIVPNLPQFEFVPTTTSHWIFKLGDNELSKSSEDSSSGESSSGEQFPSKLISVVRRKRSEEFTEVEATEDGSVGAYGINKTDDKRNWFEKMVDFFFGQGDEARGEPPGIFVRMANWMKKISCKINGPCPGESGTPSPDFRGTLPPHPVVPPANPEAEPVPVPDPGNDVKK